MPVGLSEFLKYLLCVQFPPYPRIASPGANSEIFGRTLPVGQAFHADKRRAGVSKPEKVRLESLTYALVRQESLTYVENAGWVFAGVFRELATREGLFIHQAHNSARSKTLALVQGPTPAASPNESGDREGTGMGLVRCWRAGRA